VATRRRTRRSARWPGRQRGGLCRARAGWSVRPRAELARLADVRSPDWALAGVTVAVRTAAPGRPAGLAGIEWNARANLSNEFAGGLWLGW